MRVASWPRRVTVYTSVVVAGTVSTRTILPPGATGLAAAVFGVAVRAATPAVRARAVRTQRTMVGLPWFGEPFLLIPGGRAALATGLDQSRVDASGTWSAHGRDRCFNYFFAR